MDNKKAGYTSIDDYIADFPEAIQTMLEALRATIKVAAPDAEEKISYQMPTFAQEGNLVHFAAYKNHIGFYPTPAGIEAFKDDLSGYKSSKGAVQFPIGEPLPLDLISKIVQFRVVDNLKKAEFKASMKKKKS
jgi:uncharacterized protein YdhG (YjbR/CyaY superfamily)